MLDRIQNTYDFCGGGLLQTVEIPYSKMVKMLGKPIDDCDEKTDVEWSIKFKGECFSIYNYKDGINYNGLSGIPNECLSDFHIGGSVKSYALELKEYLLDNIPEGEDFPAITQKNIEKILERVKELNYIQYTQLNNFLDEIGA